MIKQSYYSLIQYSEYPESIEFVNIGVAVFASDPSRVLVKFGNPVNRIQKMFGVKVGQHFQLLCQSLQDRLKYEFSGGWNSENLQRFIGMRSGKMRLSPLRSILLKDAEKDIQNLFEMFVSDGRSNNRGQKIQTKLKLKLEEGGVVDFLDRPEPIELPQGVTINAPYAYQNGAYNLINAVSLKGEPDIAIEKAGKVALEGQWLFETANRMKRLVVVGDLLGQQDNFASAISATMKKHDVTFYSLENMSGLLDDIRKNKSKALLAN